MYDDGSTTSVKEERVMKAGSNKRQGKETAAIKRTLITHIFPITQGALVDSATAFHNVNVVEFMTGGSGEEYFRPIPTPGTLEFDRLPEELKHRYKSEIVKLVEKSKRGEKLYFDDPRTAAGYSYSRFHKDLAEQYAEEHQDVGKKSAAVGTTGSTGAGVAGSSSGRTGSGSCSSASSGQHQHVPRVVPPPPPKTRGKAISLANSVEVLQTTS
ncbi:unnamed protein product, partial [Amoebophrya sp. A120]|eukprot:GSA120T00010047001.1